MARLDLRDMRRDEDEQTSQAGGVTRSQYRTQAESLEPAKLVDIAEAALAIANALELMSRRRNRAHPSTLQNLADVLRVGLRGA